MPMEPKPLQSAPRCSTINTADSAFCRKCGTRRQTDWHVKDRPNSPTRLGAQMPSRVRSQSARARPNGSVPSTRPGSRSASPRACVGRDAVRVTRSTSPRQGSKRMAQPTRSHSARQAERSQKQVQVPRPRQVCAGPRRSPPRHPSARSEPTLTRRPPQVAQHLVHRARAEPHVLRRQKLTPADLVRLQRELESQMEARMHFLQFYFAAGRVQIPKGIPSSLASPVVMSRTW